MAGLLPLRLWAEQQVSDLMGHSCFVVEAGGVGLVFDDDGIACVAVEHSYAGLAGADAIKTVGSAIARCLNSPLENLPDLLLVRSSSDAAQWISLSQAPTVPGSSALRASLKKGVAKISNSQLAQNVVEGIHRYYSMQILEPSVRGFLSILEKQFPRNDLYLFELLQNAVDDGASHIVFQRGHTELTVMHDGQPFTALAIHIFCVWPARPPAHPPTIRLPSAGAYLEVLEKLLRVDPGVVLAEQRGAVLARAAHHL